MPSIGLYNFTKKSNSTALPDPKIATWVTFTYKSECSTHSPILLIEWGTKPDFTYAQIGTIYYFITDVVYIRQKLWQLRLKEDCLGTFRDQIMASSQLVMRSNKYVDENIVDTMYPRLTQSTSELQQIQIPYDTGGTYVIATASGEGMKFFALTPSQFQSLTNQLFAETQDSLWDAIVDATTSIQRTFLNVMQYILSCHWIPFKLYTETKTSLYLGYWNTGISATEIFADTKTYPLGLPQTLDIATNAQSNRKWLNDPSYNIVNLHLANAGNIQIDASRTKSVRIIMLVDIFGKITYIVQTDYSRNYIAGDCGVSVALSANAVTDAFAGGILATAGGISTTIAGMNGGGIGKVVGGIIAAGAGEASLIPEPQTIGSTGSFASATADSLILLYQTLYDISADVSEKIGYPVNKILKMNTNGYYLVENPTLDFGDYHENQEIASMMEGGFYIE